MVNQEKLSQDTGRRQTKHGQSRETLYRQDTGRRQTKQKTHHYSQANTFSSASTVDLSLLKYIISVYRHFHPLFRYIGST